MNNNAGTARFLMLTLVFTAAFMHVFGVALLQWQLGHSSLYAYILALGGTSLSGAEGINTASYVVTCLAIGAFASWAFDLLLSLCGFVIRQTTMSESEKYWARYASNNSHVLSVEGDKK